MSKPSRPTSVSMPASMLVTLLQSMEEECGGLPIGDPLLKDIITFIDALRTRAMLNVIGRTCDELGIPYQFVEHASRSVSAEEKVALIGGSDPIYDEARERIGCAGWPIVPLRTLLLATERGPILFCGRVEDSYDAYRRAIGELLGLSGKQAKSMRPSTDDPKLVLGMDRGTISPLLESPYWKNVYRVFLVGEAFFMGTSSEETFVEVPVNHRMGLILWAPYFLELLSLLTAHGYPRVHCLGGGE